MTGHKRKEYAQFTGYEVRGGAWVALFEMRGGSDFCANKRSCLTRLANLQKGNYAHDQTALAIANWPTRKV